MNTILSRLAPELINQAPIKDSQVSMILLLDFDGVLHPYPLHVDDSNDELFQNTPQPCALMHHHPKLRLAVS